MESQEYQPLISDAAAPGRDRSESLHDPRDSSQTAIELPTRQPSNHETQSRARVRPFSIRDSIYSSPTEDPEYASTYYEDARPLPGGMARHISIPDSRHASLTDAESLLTLRTDFTSGKLLPYPTEVDESNIRQEPWRGHQLMAYRTRNLLNIIGPIVFVGMYVFIVVGYLNRKTVNDIVSNFGQSRMVFYGWFIISVFALEWANSGLAGTEAGALMKRFFAPKSPRQLMWHADKAWSTFSGWVMALVVGVKSLREKRGDKAQGAQNAKPGILWWYLTITSLLIYIAVPLSGLSMELGDGFKLGNQPAIIVGPNATSFNEIFPDATLFRIRNVWATDPVTSYYDKSNFVFARDGTKNVSTTYFNDAAMAQGNSSTPILAFFPPATKDQVHGTAWGIQLSVNCHAADPYTDLQIIKASSFSSSAQVQPPSAHRLVHYKIPVDASNDTDSYVNFASSQRYLKIVAGSSGKNQSGSTTPQALEMILWQTSWDDSDLREVPDPDFEALRKSPFVRKSLTPGFVEDVLGFGIRCDIQSITGTAQLNHETRTFSNFSEVPSLRLPNDYINNYEQTLEQIYILAAEILALSNNAWLDMNTAIGAQLYSIYSPSDPTKPINIYPLVSPQNATLALYKLLGQAAITVMDDRGKQWTGDLKTLRPVKKLVPGKIPWQLVLVLLSLWMLSSVVGAILAMNIPRRASFLDGFELFKLGYNAAHGREPQKFDGYEFYNCQALEEAPNSMWYIHNADKVTE